MAAFLEVAFLCIVSVTSFDGAPSPIAMMYLSNSFVWSIVFLTLPSSRYLLPELHPEIIVTSAKIIIIPQFFSDSVLFLRGN